MKHLIEIDISGWGITLDSPRWLGAETLIAEGDTVEELLDGASVWFCDQDGGEGPCVEVDALREAGELKRMILEEWYKMTTKVGG